MIKINEMAINYRLANEKQGIKQWGYYIGKGNNHPLIERAMEKRKQWFMIDKMDHNQHYLIANFIWQTSSNGIIFENLSSESINKQTVNTFENHFELTTKNRLIKNLLNNSEISNVFDITPLTFIIELKSDNFQCKFNEFVNYYNRYLPSSFEKENNMKFSFAEVNSQTQSGFTHNYNKYRLNKNFIDDQYLWMLKVTDYNRG